MEGADKLELVDVYVCVKCNNKVRILKKKQLKPRTCPKCGGMMAKIVVLNQE